MEAAIQERPAILVDTDDLSFSEKMDAIAAAIVVAHGEIERVTTNETADTGSYKYKYADLANVLKAAQPKLAANGLAIMQTPATNMDERGGVIVCVTTMLLHKSGQWCKSRLRMKPTQTTPQGIGSAITYARRYAAQAMLGIAPEDDDGKAASTSALTGSPAAPATNGQQKAAAPGNQQLKQMYVQARKMNASLPEDIRDWCVQNVEGYERGNALTETQSWFMYNTFRELLSTPDDAPPAPADDTAANLQATLAQPLTQNQVTSMQILFREKGFTTEAQRHEFANKLIGKPSTKMWNQGDYAKMREELHKISVPV